MTFKPSDPIVAPSRGTIRQAIRHAATADRDADEAEPIVDYLHELWRLCQLLGFDYALMVAQSAHETANWSSYWWNSRLNPAGIGITGDPKQNAASHTWKSGTEAAHAHAVHMFCYTKAGEATPLAIRDSFRLDPRALHVLDQPWAGEIRTLDDLTGTWAVDPRYAEKIAAKANAIFGGTMIVAKECPLEIAVLTGAQPNRPAIPMPDPSYVTVHEVGNTSPGADENMHRDFVHNGGGANRVSFHFVVGPAKAIQLIYLNENAWHASDGYAGRGNRDTIAIETIQVGNFDLTLAHLAWLIAEIYRNPSRFALRPGLGYTDDLRPDLVKERTKQHNYWAPDGKNCPQFIRQRGLWVPLLDAVAAELKDAAPAAPRYSPPILPEWWSEQALIDLATHRENDVVYNPLGARLLCIKETGAYAHGWAREAKGRRTRANILPGEKVDVRYRTKAPNGAQWFITKHGTWIAPSRFTPLHSIRQNDPQRG